MLVSQKKLRQRVAGLVVVVGLFLVSSLRASDEKVFTQKPAAAYVPFRQHLWEYGREDEWMLATGFSMGNCHSTHHKVVLQVLREGAQRALEGDLAPIRQMIAELAVWFPQHAQTMDAALALHLRGVGYDADSGEVRKPEAIPAAEISGCGGATCS